MRRRVVLAGFAAAALVAGFLALPAPAPDWPDRIWVRSVGVLDEDWDSARTAPDGEPVRAEFVCAWDDTVFLRARRSPVRRALDWLWDRRPGAAAQLSAWWDAIYDEGSSVRAGDAVWVEFVRRTDDASAR